MNKTRVLSLGTNSKVLVTLGIFGLLVAAWALVQLVSTQNAYASGGVPTTTAVVINYRNTVKTVTLTFDEAVKTTGSADHNFDLTKLHLRDTAGGADLVDLSGNTITETASSTTVTITLTEDQRATLIQESNTTGGDAGEIVVIIDAEAAYSGATDEPNVSGEPIAAGIVTETADNVTPTITSATLDFNDNSRELVVLFSEQVKSSTIDLTKFHINDATGTDAPVANLSGASATLATSTSITITLTEAQRATLIRDSGVAGGDAGALVLDVDASGIKDIGKNLNGGDDDNTITETADTNAPVISSIATTAGGTTNQPSSSGIILTFSESMASSSATVLVTTSNPSGAQGIWAATWSGDTQVTYAQSGGLYAGASYTFTVTAAPDLGENAVTSANNSISFSVQSSGSGGSSPAQTYGPVNPSISINSGAAKTLSPEVTLTLSVTVSLGGLPGNVLQMMVSENSGFAGASWQNYASSLPWTLSAGTGDKRVYAKFKNSYGETAVVSDTITFSDTATEEETAPAQQPSVPAGENGQAPSGSASEGKLILGQDGRTVYLVQSGMLYAFRDAGEFRSHGYSFASVVSASSEELALPLAGVKTAAQGALVKTAADPTVWLVGEWGSIHAFSTMKEFLGMGYQIKSINLVPDLQGYIQAESVAQMPR